MLKLRLLTKAISAGCILSIFMTATANASNLAKVTATSVNLRSYNSTEGQVVGTANSGDVLTITGNANNGWFKVKKNGLGEAFISSQYLSIYQTDATCIGDTVNVRTSPTVTSTVIGTAKKGQVFVTSGKCNNWYQINFNGTTGYISGEYMQGTLLQYLPEVPAPTASTETTATAVVPTATATNTSTGDIYAVVEVPSLNLREAATTESKVIKSLSSGYNLSVVGYEDGWVKVTDDNNNSGYVKAEYINLKNGKKPENKTVAKDTSSFDLDHEKNYTNKGNVNCRELIEYSKQYIGTPYVWGGTDLTAGVDCSGFVYSVYKHYGITLNRTSRDMYTQGTSVTKSELVPGDLLFFNTGGDSVISHVGMYIGNGDYIHSTNGNGNGVTISNLSDGYSRNTYVGAKRILD